MLRLAATRAALSVVVVMAIATAVGCSAAAAPSGTVLAPAPTTSTAPSVTASVSPSQAPSSPPASASAATCAVSVDHPPTVNVAFHISGSGFKPNYDIRFKIGTAPEFNASGDPHPAGLHTDANGSFGPWELRDDGVGATDPEVYRFSDGVCSATFKFTLRH